MATTRHYQKLKDYVALVSKDYGVGEKLVAALQADLAQLGTDIGIDVMQKGQVLLHAGLDHLTALGVQKLGEAFARVKAGKTSPSGGAMKKRKG
jgi:acetyl-CoA acetyltransferase